MLVDKGIEHQIGTSLAKLIACFFAHNKAFDASPYILTNGDRGKRCQKACWWNGLTLLKIEQNNDWPQHIQVLFRRYFGLPLDILVVVSIRHAAVVVKCCGG